MKETIPRYFSDFTKKLDEKFERIDERFESIDKRFEMMDKRFDKIEGILNEHTKILADHTEKLDSHFEQIGELKVIATDIQINLRNKAGHSYVESIEKRVEKLENQS
jgi:DNA anti-recombination protein RmuC